MPDDTNSNDIVERCLEKRRNRETAQDAWSRIGDRFDDKLLKARAARRRKGKRAMQAESEVLSLSRASIMVYAQR